VDGRVFVCYAREDGPFVVRLASNLKTLGIPVWLDAWDIAPGSDWDRSIDRALTDCSRLMIVLSKASVASSEVRAELRTALDLQKPIIPVLRERCDIPRQLKTIQFVDATADGMGDDAVARRALEILKAPPPAAEVPRPAGLDTAGAAEDGIRPDFTPTQHAGQRTAAEAFLERTTSDLLLELGEAETRFDWDKTIELGERILRLAGEHHSTAVRTAAAYRCRAINRESNDQGKDALRDYVRALELEPGEADTWYRCGILRRRLANGANVPGVVGDFQTASRLWHAGRSLQAAAVLEIERARGEDFLKTIGFVFFWPAMGAVFLSMAITSSEIAFVPRIAWLTGAGVAGGLFAAAADWLTRSAWGLKSDKRLALALALVLIGGLVGAGMGYLLPPRPRGEFYPAVVELFLAMPAVAAPFVVVVARAWTRGGA
jgi:hypothetical protein